MRSLEEVGGFLFVKPPFPCEAAGPFRVIGYLERGGKKVPLVTCEGFVRGVPWKKPLHVGGKAKTGGGGHGRW